jgi:hypothetical protein
LPSSNLGSFRPESMRATSEFSIAPRDPNLVSCRRVMS